MSLAPVTQNFPFVTERVLRDRIIFSGGTSLCFASSKCFRVRDAKTQKRSRLPSSANKKYSSVEAPADVPTGQTGIQHPSSPPSRELVTHNSVPSPPSAQWRDDLLGRPLQRPPPIGQHSPFQLSTVFA